MACVICKGVRHWEATTEVKTKGLKNLIKCSLIREDGLDKVFRNVESIILHTTCYKGYIRWKTNKSGEVKPCSLNLEPRKPEEKINFVFTFLPNNSKKTTGLPENDKHCQHERTNDIKTNDNISSQSIESTGLLNLKTELPNDNTDYSATFDNNLVVKLCPDTNQDDFFQNPEDEPNENCNIEQGNSYYDDSTKPFPFEHLCFICAKDISDKFIAINKKKPLKSRDKLIKVSKPTTQKSILTMLSKYDIPEYQVITQRIQDVDLIQENAGYHWKCYIKLYKPLTGLKPRGRNPADRITTTMETIVRYIEEDNLTNYTGRELMNLVDDSHKFEIRTMLKRLDERFRGKIYFTSSPGRNTVITILRDPNTNIFIEGQNNNSTKKSRKYVVVSKRKKLKKKQKRVSPSGNEDLYEDPPHSPCSDISAAGTERDTNIFCHVCSSSDRRLAALGDYADVYRSLCGEVLPEHGEQLLLCWECRASLKHALCFQKRARMSQQLLNEMQHKCLSTISVATPASSIISYKLEKLEKEDYPGDEDTELHPENTDIHPEETDPYPDDSILNPEDAIKEENIPTPEQNGGEINDYRASNDDDDDDARVAKRPRRSTRTKKCDTTASVKSDEDDNSSSSESRCSVWEQPKRTNKEPKPKSSTITLHCGVKVLDLEEVSKIEHVAIEPQEVIAWRGRERDSTYFKNLERKCETCITSAEDDHESLYHSKDNNYVCDICEVTCPTKPGLDSHLAGHCYLFRCAICGYQCCNQHHMMMHVEMHRRVYQCVECGHSFRSLDVFKEHYKELHSGADCDHCGKRFSHKLYLEKHIQRRHIPQVCTKCNIVYKRYHLLREHMELKHRVCRTEAAYCVQCDVQFDNEKLLKRHVYHSVKHAKEWKREPKKRKEKEEHKCPECPNVYRSMYTLRSHYDLVHEQKVKFHCQRCDKAFPRKSNYDAHMRSHAGIKPPKNKFCDVCGRGFATNRILLNHTYTHTGERPHACALCPARFAQRAALQSHKKRLHKQH